jgi:hypothetical protein
MRDFYRIVLPATLLMASLVPGFGQGARPSGITDDELFGNVIKASKWDNPNIHVCWENTSQDDDTYRAIVRTAAEETWQRYSRARFSDWGQCDDNSPGLHIRISDEQAHTNALGRFLDMRPEGMILNFAFNTWSEGCQQKRDFCIYAIAAHEFGHALGFAHEQNRADAPPECRLDSQGPIGDYNVTKYDPTSIMNWCNLDSAWRWNGDGKLSALDIEAVQKFYGPPL